MKNTFDELYWASRWGNGQTGWDIGMPAPAIVAYFENIADKTSSILIPGCGNAYEAESLYELGFTNITVMDIVKDKVEDLRERLAGKKINVLHGDFFKHESQYDYIVEHTFFCSLSVNMRPAYAQQASCLLKEGGKLVGLLFNRTFEGDEPPFGGNQEEYQQLFAPYFSKITMHPCLNSIPPRAGKELEIELTK